ncbi:MAG: hypothetical protein Q4B70_18160 [Lachnospiraceae bacterium]|nr:hypothetical protein [Lachnospiraceae bacterium]
MIKLTLKKVSKNLSPEVIAEHLEESPAFIAEICEILEKYPEADTDEIYEKLKSVRN